MSCALVIDSNLIDERLSFTFSSERSGYPATNALDISKRKRTWRSAGYWEIVSGDNTLVIKDAAAGGNLTATIAAGEYATDALFFAALKAGLEAASDSTFTITRDATTNKIKITAALGGAATHFQIIATHADSADMCAVLGFATASDLTGALNYTADLLRIHTSEWFIFDFGSPVEVNAVLGFADRNYPIKISSTATVTIQGNLTNDFSAPIVDEALSVSDFGIGAADKDGIGGLACRYWKLKIIDRDNAAGYVEIGALIIGTHVDILRSPVFPFAPDEQDLSMREYSEGGQPITSKRGQTTIMPLFWELLSTTEFEALHEVFETYGLHSPFAIVLDVDGVFSSTFMKWARIVRFAESPREQLSSYNNWTMQWNVREDL